MTLKSFKEKSSIRAYSACRVGDTTLRLSFHRLFSKLSGLMYVQKVHEKLPTKYSALDNVEVMNPEWYLILIGGNWSREAVKTPSTSRFVITHVVKG